MMKTFHGKRTQLSSSRKFFFNYSTKFLWAFRRALHTASSELAGNSKAKQSSPATRHGGAWLETRYSSYTFMTSVLDGVSGQCHFPAAVCSGEGPPVPTVHEAGWAPEPVWTQKLEEKSFSPAGNRTPIAR
jgi:hypothetical protein